jgi:hypothetical protein
MAHHLIKNNNTRWEELQMVYQGKFNHVNGVVAQCGYDAASRLTSLTYTEGATTLGTLTYTYDVVGNRTQVGGTWARTALPQAVSSATYNAANRLTNWGRTN